MGRQRFINLWGEGGKGLGTFLGQKIGREVDVMMKSEDETRKTRRVLELGILQQSQHTTLEIRLPVLDLSVSDMNKQEVVSGASKKR